MMLAAGSLEMAKNNVPKEERVGGGEGCEQRQEEEREALGKHRPAWNASRSTTFRALRNGQTQERNERFHHVGIKKNDVKKIL